jgi:hypothetical protein
VTRFRGANPAYWVGTFFVKVGIQANRFSRDFSLSEAGYGVWQA